MIRTIICGASGKMGGFVANSAINDGDFKIVGGVDKVNIGQPYPIFNKFSDINVEADVIIDFSHPSLLDGMLEYIDEYADMLHRSQTYNFRKWNILNTQVGKNPTAVVSANTYEKQIDYLKNFYTKRLEYVRGYVL